MVKLSKNTQNDLVYGTDGETALGEGFGRPLPYAQHLLCDLHMKDNVMLKLNELGIRGKASELKLSNIFGKDIGSTRVPGLIDYKSPTIFDKINFKRVAFATPTRRAFCRLLSKVQG